MTTRRRADAAPLGRPGQDTEILEPTTFELPPGACDCHAHVIAENAVDYPLVADRSYTPAPAPETRYLAMLDALGMARGVLVQISVYGTDNRYLLEVLRRHPDRLRGVAVAARGVSADEIRCMHEAGVRGLRINTAFGGGVPLNDLEALAERVAPMGWHLQLLIDGRQFPALLPRLRRLQGRFVVDHMGYLPARQGVDSPAFQALLELVAERDWWVKLSAPYRLAVAEAEGMAPDVPPGLAGRSLSPLSRDGLQAYPGVQAMAQALAAHAPERLVWGSDWPHVATASAPDAGRLRNLLSSWIPDAAQRRRILVDNPAHLYDFPH
ncbi:MAG: amidohydrolase [Pigmentiphaga sp.]